MKKKLLTVAAAVAVLTTLLFCLSGCTVAGKYESPLGSLEFTGSDFTYKMSNIEVSGSFTTEKFSDEYESQLGTIKIDQKYVSGIIKYTNKDGKDLGIGFYGKNEDGKEYASYLAFVFTKK